MNRFFLLKSVIKLERLIKEGSYFRVIWMYIKLKFKVKRKVLFCLIFFGKF